MLLSVIVIVLVGAVAYFHYVQGFFSATLSAMLAILSAVLAFSLHEWIVRSLLGGKMADQAHAMMLVASFAVIYTFLRVIFDKAIPGNIRLPVAAEKIGSAAMGAVAGCYAIGILVIAAQCLPFGPSIAGYSRYTLNDKQDVRVPTRGQSMDSYSYDTLKNETLSPGDHSSLIIPVDDIVVGTARALSDGGALAGGQSLSVIHPSYVDELFLQRLGVQTGAKHVAYNLPADKQVDLKGLYTIDSIPQADAEPAYVTNRWSGTGITPVLKSDPEKINLIVRLTLSRNASDTDSNVRISPASVRLVAKAKNYTPLGTLQNEEGPVVRVTRPDDFIIVKGDGIVDFVFQLPRDQFGIEPDSKNKSATLQFAKDVFLEAKRLGYVDLSGQEIKREVPPSDGKEAVFRKKDIPAPKVAPGSGGSAAKEISGGPIELKDVKVTSELGIVKELNVGAHEGDDASVTFRSGNGKLKEKKLAKLEVEASDSLKLLQTGDSAVMVHQLWAPGGQKIVQVTAEPGKNPWEWADKLGQFELKDDKGSSYKPRGAWVKVKAGTTDKMVAKWDAEGQVNDLSYKAENRPLEIWIAFVVPENTSLKELRFDNKRIKSLDLRVN